MQAHQLQQLIDYSLRNAILIHQTYNNNQTLENLQCIQKIIDSVKELKNENRNLKMNYNELYFDFTNYKAIQGEEIKETEYTHDSIDIYNENDEI
jgi:DNA integrity scanning protein DisA with diadenylate cyclase activity